MGPAFQPSLAAPRGRASREWFLLGAASISSAALLFAAWFGVGDPELAGRAELARVASELEASVQHDWEQLRRGSWAWTGQGGMVLRQPTYAPIEPPAPIDEQPESVALFEALLGEVQRLGREPESQKRQLGLVQQALDCGVGVRRRGRAHVLAISLALEAGQRDLALEHWELVQEELQGHEAEQEDGIALWLKAALAIEGILDEGEREAMQLTLGQLWRSGKLALPPPYNVGAMGFNPLEALSSVQPLRAALGRRVAQLGSVDADCFSERMLIDRGSALAEALRRDLPARVDGLATVIRVGDWDWVLCSVTGAAQETERGVIFLPSERLPRKLAQVAGASGVLPEGFHLLFAGQTPSAGDQLIRSETSLIGGPLRLSIYHSDPDSYVSRMQSKRWFLRGGLLLMALFTAVAGLVSFRALRRERRLAGLKSAFVANVSHELRTPIASILLMAENLELGRVPDEPARQRYTKLIRREAGRLRRLVDDVLDFSRLERGEGLRVQRAPMLLAAFAELLEKDLRSHVEDAGGELEFAQLGDDAALSIDAEALRRATLNLVDNALKHSGSQDVQVRLAVEGKQLCIRVRDRGRGLPSTRLASIMEPFERDEHADAAAGTGLGLSIVREIARAHGGSAELKSPVDGPGLLAQLCIPIKDD